ncbi:MAG TPA: universal stress protein [Candidatus Limnocylindria bacterium]|jgi:nucleotide-binding universal stress UspA family protein
MFRRRPSESDASSLPYRRILIPVAGADADDDALRLSAMLLTAGGDGTPGEVVLVHVIEVGFERTLDTEDEKATAFADEILGRGAEFLETHKIPHRVGMLQARAAGPAIVDEAVASNADLIVMGLRYKRRFGGSWDAGRTVPYVMRNSKVPVWCLRARTEELALSP